MESELSGIFEVKPVIVFGSLGTGTQRKAAFAV